MADDPKFHDLFRSLNDSDATAIDTRKVIARSRRRRLPGQVAIGGAFAVAIGGIFVGTAAGLGGSFGSAGSASDSAGTTAEYSESAPKAPVESAPDPATGSSAGSGSSTDVIKRAPAEKINLCTGALAEVAPSETGLVLEPRFDDASVGTKPIQGTVTMTNTGSETWKGTTAAAPAITLSQDGITVWHSNGPTITMVADVDLAPGESMDYPATLVPVICGIEDDSAEQFRDDLPAASPGEYQVSAMIDFFAEDDLQLITGQTQTITLR